MKKLIRALLSRFKKTKTNPEVERKREICRTCPFNSKNSSKKTFKIFLIQKLSKLYSILTNKAEEVVAIDGVFMVCKKSDNLNFDTKFNGFHNYDLNLGFDVLASLPK